MPALLAVPAVLARPAVLLAVPVLLAACASTASDPDADRAALLARIDQFHDSIRDGDKAAYADVFTDDFLFTWSRDGQIYAPETIFPNVVPTPDLSVIVDEQLVRLHGDAAAVSFRVRKAEAADEPGVRVTFSYVRKSGVWKVMATHSTKIVPPEAAETTESSR